MIIAPLGYYSGGRLRLLEVTIVRVFSVVAGLLTLVGVLLMMGAALADAPAAPPTEDKYLVAITPDNAFNICFCKNGKYFGGFSTIGWGAGWAWAPPSKAGFADSTTKILDVTTPFYTNQGKNEFISLGAHVRKSSAKSVIFGYTLSAIAERDLIQLSDGFSFIGKYDSGTIDLTLADGSKGQTLPIPTQRSAYDKAVSKAIFHVKGIGDITAEFNPPLTMHVEGDQLRMRLAYDKFPAGTQRVGVRLTFPGPVDFIATKEDIAKYTKTLADASWFTFTPTNDTGPSVIGMEPWTDAPAGSHGVVQAKDDHFSFADGTPVKFWGSNLAYGGQCAPEHAQADLTAARFAKYGINCVRMHKFTNPGEGIGGPNSALDIDPAGLDKLDYMTAQLKKHGVYYGWSHTYHFQLRPGDKAALANWQEAHDAQNGDTYGLINGCPDIQDLYIQMVVKYLTHKNPYTGLTYAQDPALAFLEVQNEDDIFFWTFSVFDKCPTYKQKMQQRFGAWLKAKYVTDAAYHTAWGGTAKLGDPVDFNSNPWFYTDDGLGQMKDNPQGMRQRVDSALFLHDEQNKFYGKFTKAVRAAGYKGPINGSPWQAPPTLPQYLNLLSDAKLDYVDRHNYYGGDELAMFDSMLSDPGSGYLNTGLLQVAHKPFALSEWTHVYPNVNQAEGPAIMAAYGLGLQGWDASYQFQSSSTGGGYMGEAGHFPWTVWNVDVPNQIGEYPALARMIARGDVKEGDPVAVRRISDEELQAGKLNTTDTAVVNGDVKAIAGVIPQAALAAGKVLVDYIAKATPSTIPDMTKFTKDTVITSNTGQLRWDSAEKANFTINTPGTVGLVGYAPDKPVKLNNVTISMTTPYSVVIITALDKGKTLDNCSHALVSVVARICNTGFTYYAINNHILNNGAGPIQVEGVKGTVTIAGRGIQAVNILDQDGRAQDGKTTKVSADGTFAIDTTADKTLYYEVVFK